MKKIHDIDFLPRQAEAWDYLHSPKIDELLYGGAKGGGKSVLGCYWMWNDALQVAKRFFKQKPEFPYNFGWMGRKIAKDFTDTTLETWKKIIPRGTYKIVGKPAEIIILDRVKIKTWGLDSRASINKFNSAEFARIFLDQAEEATQDDVAVLRASVNRNILDLVDDAGKRKKVRVKGKILFTANPAPCWLKEQYIDKIQPNQAFVKALPSDNIYVGKEYIATLKRSFGHRPCSARNAWQRRTSLAPLRRARSLAYSRYRDDWSRYASFRNVRLRESVC